MYLEPRVGLSATCCPKILRVGSRCASAHSFRIADLPMCYSFNERMSNASMSNKSLRFAGVEESIMKIDTHLPHVDGADARRA